MFSANENLALRQHKKRVVDYVESCIPDEALDMGTMVMAMQVSCKAPGCVPLETAIIIVFPKLGVSKELIQGLPESCGGNYKTKVLKPMADITKDDVLDALPPAFPGGRRTMEKLCIQARDVMLGQITQLFAEDDQNGRQLMAEYLQICLQEYIDRGCTPPEWGEPFSSVKREEENFGDNPSGDEGKAATSEPKAENRQHDKTTAPQTSPPPAPPSKGNFVFKRPVDSEDNPTRIDSLDTTKYTTVSFTVAANASKQPGTTASTSAYISSQSIMAQLNERQHAPGIRQPGCPCCDPDNATNALDQMIAL
jgi:hypothetical protein